MDYAVAVMLFLMGFVLALVAGKSFRLRKDRVDLRRLPLEGGAVRLDLMGRGGAARRENAAQTLRTEAEAGEPPATIAASLPEGPGPQREARARRRK